MSVQTLKVNKSFRIACACLFGMSALLFFFMKSTGGSQVATQLRVFQKTVGSLVGKPVARPLQSQPFSNQNNVAPNFYDQLPPLDTVIAQFKSLELTEIEEKIMEVEGDLERQGLIEKSNAKSLDEAGYRELARLLQISDALYNVKIERQLSALENDLGLKKRGV